MLNLIRNSLSLRRKLFATHFLVTSIALLLVFVVLVAYEFLSYRNDLLQELTFQLTLVSQNISPAVAFEDQESAEETIHALGLNNNIEDAYVIMNDGTFFARYRRSSVSQSRHTPLTQIQPDGPVEGVLGTLHVTKYILVNDKVAATLHIQASMAKVYRKVGIFSLVMLVVMGLAMLLARVLSGYFNRAIVNPLLELNKMVMSITSKQSFVGRVNVSSNDEVGQLSRGINAMLDTIQHRDQKLSEELAEKERYEKKLDQLAYYDQNTHLPNRHFFSEHLNRLIDQADIQGGFLYLLMLDLDNFKIVNDTLGHHAGDQLIKMCAERLRTILPNDEQVYRLGGDEFAITLAHAESPYDIEMICNQIVHAISQKFVIEGQEIYVGVSVGAVKYTKGKHNQISLVKHADAAMYWAKADGKNTYKFYSQQIEEERFNEQALIDQLHRAMHNRELFLCYQPVIDVKSESIIGFEALLRWQHPTLGLVSPTIFIPIAESTGLIRPMGMFVVEQALAQIKKWQAKYNQEFFVNINVSAKQLADRNFINKIQSRIYQYAINPKTINFELTETVLMDNLQSSMQLLKSLRTLGAGVAIDDFGTGHSSMSYLKALPVNTIKIDKAFTEGLPNDMVDVAIIKSIFALARSLDMDVVAEGIETKAQHAFIKRHRCTKAQGFLYSKPLTPEEVEAKLDALIQSANG